jgi:hypothetical protein
MRRAMRCGAGRLDATGGGGDVNLPPYIKDELEALKNRPLPIEGPATFQKGDAVRCKLTGWIGVVDFVAERDSPEHPHSQTLVGGVALPPTRRYVGVCFQGQPGVYGRVEEELE